MHDFQSYDLIIDARSPREYEDDHVPGAINWPVVNNEEYAEVGTLHRTDKLEAYRIGVRYSLNNIARHIHEDIPRYDPKSRILVYCFRGGKRSKLWVDALETIGYNVERLSGGWKNYRRSINEQLISEPRRHKFIVLSGATGCGKTRLLYALREAGGQVLDLEDIAAHRGSVLGALPGKNQPTQKFFDSLLIRQLSSYTTAQPIWVEAESKKIGNVQLPISLLETMRASLTIRIESLMQQRVMLWREDYRHFVENPVEMVAKLKFLRAILGAEEFSTWEDMANQGQVSDLFERVMRNHYDPSYRRSTLRNYPSIDDSPRVVLDDLSTDGLAPVARSMRLSFEG